MEAWVGIEPAYADLQSRCESRRTNAFAAIPAPQSANIERLESLMQQGPSSDCGADQATSSGIQ